MAKICIGTPIIPKQGLIRCCSCKKEYDFKGNIYKNKKDTILICPYCGLRHSVGFKLFDNKIDKLIKIDKLNLAAIDIGNSAIDRITTSISGYTYVNKDNPANASGTITSVEIWANMELSNCEVATFYIVSGNNLSTRDTEAIGTVTAGSKQTFTVNLTVQTGDFIGIHYTAGLMEKDATGLSGLWYNNLDQIPCTDVLFSFNAGQGLSLYGTGVSPVTHHLAGTSVNAVSAIGAIAAILDFAGTSANVFSTLGAISGRVRLSGTSANVVSTIGAISAALVLQGTSANVFSTIGAIGLTPKLSGMSVNVFSTVAPELVVARVQRILGTSVNAISTIGDYLGLRQCLLGTSVNKLTTVGGLWLNTPWWAEVDKESASWAEVDKESASWAEVVKKQG